MDHLVAWLTLKHVAGIGNHLVRRLVTHFGSAEHALKASGEQLARVKGMTSRRIDAVQRHRIPEHVHREIEQCEKRGITLIAQDDPDYPALLLNIPDPPPVLYCKGQLAPDWGHIAVVGSRCATSYGRRTAERLSGDLVLNGLSVISGMARGIDTAAHRGALAAGGPTVAVLGSGLNKIYPHENRGLFYKIAESGAVISEFGLDEGPQSHHFPQRNRIISGMALGTVVVEASDKSGALITARLAAEQGREVYAVPGNVHAPTSNGPHRLIRQGAALVETVDDILQEIAPHVVPVNAQRKRADDGAGSNTPAAELNADQRHVYDAIPHEPVHIDWLVNQCAMPAARITAVLGELEIAGVVVQEPGKFFVRG